jgi:hypothetical protein
MNGRSPAEVASLINMLAAPGGFEDTLSYVSLPVLSYTSDLTTNSGLISKTYGANQGRQRDTDGHEEKTIGRNSVVVVFDKLAEIGVRHVLKLIVAEDVKSPPHTDAAIERAVTGRDPSAPHKMRQEGGIDIEIWYVP